MQVHIVHARDGGAEAELAGPGADRFGQRRAATGPVWRPDRQRSLGSGRRVLVTLGCDLEEASTAACTVMEWLATSQTVLIRPF